MAKTLGLARLQRQILALPVEQKVAAAEALVSGLEDLAGRLKAAAHHPEIAAHISVKEGRAFIEGGDSAALKADAGLSARVVAETSGKTGESIHNPFWDEFGTAPHSTEKGAVRAKGKLQSEAPIHPGTSARPWWWPTVRAHRKRLRSRMIRAANKGAKKAAGK